MGQRQRWYLLEFIGDEKDINIATIHPEFSQWKWLSHHDLVSVIVPFKRELYEKIIVEFLPFLQK
jgi:putative (di)nucleoside polyphosphate hydrolase